jgi:hypothetical protein
VLYYLFHRKDFDKVEDNSVVGMEVQS